MKTPLISKNRQANELREQAHKIRHELMDASVALSAEQVEKMTNDMRALDMRAQTAAEFTPEYVEKVTGVKAADIVKFAKEFATAQPSAIRLGVALERPNSRDSGGAPGHGLRSGPRRSTGVEPVTWAAGSGSSWRWSSRWVLQRCRYNSIR